jgi:hypothetical protein
MGKIKATPGLPPDQVNQALEVASVIHHRETLTSNQRQWLVDLLHGLASDALEHNPAHRKAKNSTRDTMIAMEYFLTGKSQSIVAKRWKAWNVTPRNVQQIVHRLRVDVQQLIADSTSSKEALLRVVKTFRDRRSTSSVTRKIA